MQMIKRKKFKILPLAVMLTVALGLAPALQAQYYFDTNGTNPGFGSANGATGSALWSTDATGESATATRTFANSDILCFGTGTLGYTGTVTVSANVKVSTVNIGSASGDITFNSSTFELISAYTGLINSNNNQTIVNSTMNGNAGCISQLGIGTLILTATGSTIGGTTVAGNGVTTISGGGTIKAAKLANSGTASSIGKGADGADSRILFNNGTLIHTGTTASGTDRDFTIKSGGATIKNDSTDAADVLVWSGTPTLDTTNVTTRSLTLGGSNTGTNTFSGILANRVNCKMNLAKSGVGKWILTAASYTGTTTLSGGTLSFGTGTTSVGTLAVTGDAVLDLGDGTGSLKFAISTGVTWSGNLTLTGTLGATSLRFGTSATALLPEQQARMRHDGKALKLDTNGYVIYAPPSGTVIQFF